MQPNAEIFNVDNKTCYIVSKDKPCGEKGNVIWIHEEIYRIIDEITSVLPVDDISQRMAICSYIKANNYVKGKFIEDGYEGELTTMIYDTLDLLGFGDF